MTTTLPQPSTARPGPAEKKRTSGAAPAKAPGKGPAKAPARPRTRPAAGARPAREARSRTQARAPRTPFVLLIVGLLGGALVSLLLLNTVLAEDAFRLKDLQQQNTRMLHQEQALKVEVSKAEAPGELAKRARHLGMRPGPMTPRFINADHTGTAPDAGPPAKRHTASGKHHAKKHTHARGTAKPGAHQRTRHGARSSADSGDHAFAGGGQ